MIDEAGTGREDDAAFLVGIGFTDIVKRPTSRADAISAAELEHGRELLAKKLRRHRPSLLIFTFKKTATALPGPFKGHAHRPELECEGARAWLCLARMSALTASQTPWSSCKTSSLQAISRKSKASVLFPIDTRVSRFSQTPKEALLHLSQAREGYLRWLLATRDLSPHTVRAYRSDLGNFEVFAGARTPVKALDRSTLVDFLENQRASALSPASLRRRASALRGFSRWLLAQGLITSDPWLNANVAAGRGRKLPRVLSAKDLDRLLVFLKQIAGVGPSPTHFGLVPKRPHESTTLLAVALMVSTGVRVHEVVGFRHQDIDLTGRAIRLVGKGRREREVFLTNDWIAALTEAYLETRKTLDLSHSRLLFNLHYAPLTPAAMRSRLSKAAKASGISQHVTPHMLRHTAATQLIEAGVDIRYIQRLLGHASLSTTEIYTHVSDHALKRVVSEADVLGRLTEAR